jgi:hypothetical protein
MRCSEEKMKRLGLIFLVVAFVSGLIFTSCAGPAGPAEGWWGQSETPGGKFVTMMASNLPPGTLVKFVIYEDDGGWPKYEDKEFTEEDLKAEGDDYYSETLLVKVDDKGEASVDKKMTWCTDRWWNPEFYFFVKDDKGNIISKLSKGLLTVKPSIKAIEVEGEARVAIKGVSVSLKGKARVEFPDPPGPIFAVEGETAVPGRLTLSADPEGWSAYLDETEFALNEGEYIDVTINATSPATEEDEYAEYTLFVEPGYYEENGTWIPYEDWDYYDNIGTMVFEVIRAG